MACAKECVFWAEKAANNATRFIFTALSRRVDVILVPGGYLQWSIYTSCLLTQVCAPAVAEAVASICDKDRKSVTGDLFSTVVNDAWLDADAFAIAEVCLLPLPPG